MGDIISFNQPCVCCINRFLDREIRSPDGARCSCLRTGVSALHGFAASPIAFISH